MQHSRLIAALSLALLSSWSALHAQASSARAEPATGSNWSRVQALPPGAKLHITMDHGGKTCRVFAVSDDALTCSTGDGAGAVLQRADIRHIRLAHYGRSALVGAGIGGGIGAISGAIGGRVKPCPAGQTLCLNGIGIGAGGVAAIFGVGGAALGGLIGGVTDMTRGSAIYTRP